MKQIEVILVLNIFCLINCATSAPTPKNDNSIAAGSAVKSSDLEERRLGIGLVVNTPGLKIGVSGTETSYGQAISYVPPGGHGLVLSQGQSNRYGCGTAYGHGESLGYGRPQTNAFAYIKNKYYPCDPATSYSHTAGVGYSQTTAIAHGR